MQREKTGTRRFLLRTGMTQEKDIRPVAFILLLVLSLAFWGCTSAPESPESHTGADGEEHILVSFKVSCEEALEAGNETAKAVSDNGIMIDETMELAAGSSVYDALEASGAVLGTRTGSMGTYVYSINGLEEKAAGSESGWKYYVNDVDPGQSSDKTIISDGDRIEWRFVLSL